MLAALPEMAVNAVPGVRIQQAAMLADEVRRTAWELPGGFEEVHFHILGMSRKPWPVPRSAELSVISPFVRDEALHALRRSTGRGVSLVSRTEELDALRPETRELFESLWTLDDAAETEDGDDEEDRDTLGLHAKALVCRRGWYTHLFVGSANATNAALLGAANLEVMVELVGRWSVVGAPAALTDTEHMGSVLVPYRAQPLDPEAVKARAIEAVLERGRNALSDADLRLRCLPSDNGWTLTLHPDAPLPLEGIATIRVWPLTVSPDLGVDAAPLLRGQDVRIGPFAAVSITGLVAFEIAVAGAEKKLRFSLNLPVEGMPPDRDSLILRTVIQDRDGFARYLMLLLGDPGDEASLPQAARAAAGGGGPWAHLANDGRPLLEEMTRAYARHPERLLEVQRVVEKLRQGREDADVLPEEFLSLWDVFTRAMSRRKK
ncbi:MAG: phospholipase D family protein [Deltaproteobacteria bacterium]|nr:phospholipase D family protein [Deltaproteobacteria bacterium]